MTATIKEYMEKLDVCLHEKDCRYATFLGTLESNTGISRTKIVLGLGGFLAFWLMVGYGKEFLCFFIGFAYPAYASVKAIESAEKDDDTKWLTYWVVFSLFSLVESVTDLFLSWVPFYFLVKCLFLIYCMVPVSWNGSVTIYYKIIRPFILRHESQIDAGIKSAAKFGKEALNDAKTAGANLAADSLLGDFKKDE